jgi:hypothetical protein
MASNTFPSQIRVQKTDTITSTQAWVAPADVTNVDILLVAGGGAGGGVANTVNYSGGGGGGGGVLERSVSVTPSTSYTVTIGAGGAITVLTTGAQGGNGANSSFGSLAISYGGQGGAGANLGFTNATTEIGSGAGFSITTAAPAGAGGGAGFMPDWVNSGVVALFPTPGIKQGGYGLITTSAISRSGNTGLNGFGAGGGGGQAASNTKTQFGGLNAGDGALSGVVATAATANRGGGGGGACYSNALYNATNGGSGVCIIKYWSAF